MNGGTKKNKMKTNAEKTLDSNVKNATSASGASSTATSAAGIRKLRHRPVLTPTPPKYPAPKKTKPLAAKEPIAAKVIQPDSKDLKEPKEPKATKEPKEPKTTKEPKEPKELKNAKAPKEPKEPKTKTPKKTVKPNITKSKAPIKRVPAKQMVKPQQNPNSESPDTDSDFVPQTKPGEDNGDSEFWSSSTEEFPTTTAESLSDHHSYGNNSQDQETSDSDY